MRNSKILWILLLWQTYNVVLGSKYYVTYADLANCKEIEVNSADYKTFFKVEHLMNGTTTRNKTEVLRLQFYVLAAKDAHILLTSTDQPTILDRVYEIVIGAGNNKFSVLREKIKSNRLVTTIEEDILSQMDATPINIIQLIDGSLNISIPYLKHVPLLSYQDNDPVVVNYISFSSYGKSKAKWFYDCKNDSTEETIEMEDKTLTNIERISVHIFENYTDSLPPKNLSLIKFSFVSAALRYDHISGIFNIRGDMKIYWTDNRLHWDPSDYDNITFIVSPLFSIWYTRLKIINGAKESFKKFDPWFETVIYFNGSIELLIQSFEIDSWCFEGNTDWPNDDTVCEMLIRLDTEENIRLVYDGHSPLNRKPNELSEWDLKGIVISDVENISATREDQHSVSLKFKLSRNSVYYYNLFYTPAYASCIIVLLSFFLEGKYRGTLNLLSIVIIFIAFASILKHAPVSYIPKIVFHYQKILFTGILSYILHVAIIWLNSYPPKWSPSYWIMVTLRCSFFQLIFGSFDYMNSERKPWMEIVRVLNRIVFIFIAVSYCIQFLF